MIKSIPAPPATVSPPRHDIEILVSRHGLWRVLRALAGVMVRPKRRRPALPEAHKLSKHLRRDIGIAHDPPPRRYWDL